MKSQSERTQVPVMPYSPLDALLDALPQVRKAGRVTKEDNVSSVQARLAAVYEPIVKKIREQVLREAIESGHLGHKPGCTKGMKITFKLSDPNESTEVLPCDCSFEQKYGAIK